MKGWGGKIRFGGAQREKHDGCRANQELEKRREKKNEG